MWGETESTRIYKDQNSLYCQGRPQTGNLTLSVIPPLPNLAKRAIRVQYFNFGARHLVWGITTGLGIGTANDALSQNSLIFPLRVWQQVPGASTHMRTSPRPLGHHLFPILPFSSPSVPVQLPSTQIRGSLRIAWSELPDPAHRPPVKPCTYKQMNCFHSFTDA